MGTQFTARQQSFVRHYVAGRLGVRGNATRAAVAAGFARRSAEAAGSRLLRNVKVAAAIKRLHAKAEAQAERSAVNWIDLIADAQEVLIDVMAGEGGKGSALRLAAANAVLDRALGKPAARLQHSGSMGLFTLSDALDELPDEAPPTAPAVASTPQLTP